MWCACARCHPQTAAASHRPFCHNEILLFRVLIKKLLKENEERVINAKWLYRRLIKAEPRGDFISYLFVPEEDALSNQGFYSNDDRIWCTRCEVVSLIVRVYVGLRGLIDVHFNCLTWLWTPVNARTIDAFQHTVTNPNYNII